MSALRPSRSGRPTLRTALAVAAMVALLGACTQGRTVPDKYGDTTRNNFLEGCAQTASSDSGEGDAFSDDEARDICVCAYERIVEDIPFSEFKEVNEQQEEEPTALPEEFQDIMKDCVDSESSPA
jgi:hypothetical protein